MLFLDNVLCFSAIQIVFFSFIINPQEAKVLQELKITQSYTSDFISAIDSVILRLAFVNCNSVFFIL